MTEKLERLKRSLKYLNLKPQQIEDIVTMVSSIYEGYPLEVKEVRKSL